jgi:enoyl-CoA hydratase/carnithine racemase
VSSAEELVTLTVDGPVATLTLNRASKLNALMPATFDALRGHLDRLGGAQVGCLVLTGAGRSFSAGHDLEHVGGSSEQREFEAATIDAIEAFPAPTIAAVRGHCLTGGLELALACDILVGTEGATFGDTHTRWGLVPVWGLSVRLPERVGRSRARELSFTARVIDSAEALRIGLIDHRVPDGELESHVDALAAEINGNSREANRIYKSLYADSAGKDRLGHLAAERSLPYGRPADAAERLAAR